MAPANAVLESTVNGPAESVDAGPQHGTSTIPTYQVQSSFPRADAENPSTSFPVLDLPQLYRKPSAQTLLAAIALLAVDPPSWTGDAKPSAISEDGIPSYLTRIISSPLAWIESDSDKEAVWESASKRLAERSGRTALPSVSRTFSIPVDDPRSTIDIKLHEPSLTGDNLGHKTWVASYLLAKRLPDLLPRHFPAITRSTLTDPNPQNPHPNPNPNPDPDPTPRRPRILELGAGTGLVGIAASALFQTTTHLTDLPAILPNLTHNIASNAHLTAGGSTVTAAPLDWSDFSSSSSLTDKNHHGSGNGNERPPSHHPFDLILASDSLYAPQHPSWLTDVIGAFLRHNDGHNNSARVMIMLPFRSVGKAPGQGSVEEAHEELRGRMLGRGFVVVEEGEEEGWDDWVDLRAKEGGRVVVRCWWCVWRWG